MAEIGLYYYGARWFDPALAHFVQADTIVPETGNPLAWDRYLYTLGNPIIYNDPTGHDVGCSGRDASQCVSYSKVNSTVIRRQILDKHNQLVSLIRQGRISDLIGFSQLVEFAASYTPYNARDFTQNAGAVLTGHASGHAAGNEVRIQIQNHMAERGVLFDLNAEYTPEYLSIASQGELMQSGYDSTFQDPGAGGNQAHHYWFFVQVGYESSFPVGVVGSALHETIVANDRAGMSYEDYALGVEGAKLGELLAWGIIGPKEAGAYIYHSLSPGSPAAYYWAHPIQPTMNLHFFP
ncbi:protein containing RHS repeat-associated core domain [Anaerolinea thermolimosa]|uniref:RHS repeat-associated core domain-containing protein n=1 Tax=Anaerolinea thermolimosa TaxID=229919 RepID=UPI00078561DB|nr:RHS repeat-associated core domain-containing protein [Anaerolinea thermolimosa]GAP06343.1 protein containing RHS repeat-associated core domain [Anaerolinea thermolimosa]